MLSFVDPSTAIGPALLFDPAGGGGSPGRSARQLALIVPMALAALLLALLGPTAPAFLSIATSTPSASSEAPVAGGSSLDADAAAPQLDHLLIADAAEPGVLTVSDARYSGRFDASGFTVAPGTGDDGFGVSLRSITRGQDIPVAASGWTGDGNVAERSVADGITERVTASEGSVEWDVVLDRAPAGAGDLVVAADVSGAPTGATAKTTTWSVDGRTVAMGEVVVKDAGGTELYRALPSVTDTGVALVVPAAVLAAAEYPLLVDPVISPEYPVTTGDPVSFEPDIAFDGTNYLVVWKDARDAEGPIPSFETRVYGARLSPSGTRLDGSGLLISDDLTTGSHPPAVDFDGTNFFVVWNTEQAGCSGGAGVACIRGARVSPAGTVLDPAGITVAEGNILDAPDVAFDGTNHLVTYQDHVDFADIYAVRVSPGGTAQTPFPVSVAPDEQTEPAVASDGTGGSLIVWQDQRAGHHTLSPGDIYSSRVGPTGGALDPEGVVVSAAVHGQQTPAVAWNGHRYLVVWTDDRHSPGENEGYWGHVYGARVTRDNSVQDPSGIPIETSWISEEPSVAAKGPTFLVVWTEMHEGRNGVYGSRVNDAGTPLDGAGLVIETGDANSSRPSVTNGHGANWGLTYRTGELSGPTWPGEISMRTVAPK
jgi:hypothetical protein